MRIRRLDIENFRGISQLTWIVPDKRTFFTLVGPGDSTKTTLLTAVERALSDRWNITFQDTDFHRGDVESAISIRVALVDLPEELMALDALGACLCGINPDGSLTHDPQEDNQACVVVELFVQSDLEPQWRAYRPGDSDPTPIKASLRARFGVYRVDERVDTHLRWSRTSALGKLTEASHGTKNTLTQANRAARDAVSAHLSPDLTVLAGQIKTEMEQLGSASFQDLKPGLDLSLNSAQGNLALFDGTVPLMNYGLGTRRLAATAVQQLAHQGSAVLLVDEVEYGLEPHRLVHLLNRLRQPGVYAQAFVTTHSPTALQHLDAADLVMVRATDGTSVARSLDTPSDLQAVIRSSPEAFLSRRILLGEGKTEYGLILAKLAEWDAARGDQPPSSTLGVIGVEGGGSNAPKVALNLLKVGYEVTVLMDSDDPKANERVPEIEAAGGVVVQWADGLNTEGAICSQLDKAGLTALIALAIDVQDNPDAANQSVTSQLAKYGAPKVDAPAQVESWIATSAAQAQAIVALAAHKCGWFKNVEKGKRLAAFMNTRPEFSSGPIAAAFDKLREATYQPRPASPAAETMTNTPADPDERP